MSNKSTKNIETRDRLIFALDVSTTKEAMEIVEELGDSVTFYKIGLELFLAGKYDELTKWLTDRGNKVFVDLKFFDVPQTVFKAVSQLKNYGATFTTVHGNDEILKAAVAAVKDKDDCKILAVTVLTSLDQGDIEDLGFKCDVKALVSSRAKRALEIGCDGVISSGLEAPVLRKEYGDSFIIVTPGIRPVENREEDDQKRTVDVEEAFENGADYIVVGRPIALADDRKKAAQDIQQRISSFFDDV